MDGYAAEGGDVSWPSAPFPLIPLFPGFRDQWVHGAMAYYLRKMQGAFDMTFGNFNSDNHFEGFDFDSFLQADLMDADQFAIDNGTEAIGGT